MAALKALADLSFQFDYASASLTATNGTNRPPLYGDGTIRIWTKDGFYARNGLTIMAGGDMVYPNLGSGTYYTAEQLGFTDQIRTVTLYVEAVKENAQTTRELAESLGKPETTIRVEMTVDGVGTFADEVRYVVANTGSFYYELMTHPELMATYMAQAVYGRDDREEFAFRTQTMEELDELGIPAEIRMMLINQQDSGLDAALYREYITGKYILTFAGTDPTSFADWKTNIAQAFALGGVGQYTQAMEIARELLNNSAFNTSNTYITGHSLGGGLASAASIVSGFHAYTFNAAGLHPLTVEGFDNNNNLSNANSLITSYKVDWDILSWSQYIAGWNNSFFGTEIPAAIGTSVTIDSEYDLDVTWGLLTMPINTILGSAGLLYAGYECHLMTQVIYGMEQLIFPNSWW